MHAWFHVQLKQKILKGLYQACSLFMMAHCISFYGMPWFFFEVFFLFMTKRPTKEGDVLMAITLLLQLTQSDFAGQSLNSYLKPQVFKIFETISIFVFVFETRL